MICEVGLPVSWCSRGLHCSVWVRVREKRCLLDSCGGDSHEEVTYMSTMYEVVCVDGCVYTSMNGCLF